ncbi:type I-MYXAN CRISPR-associated protein Cas5/Cmx5/DevS [Cystobacter ferrugineus]|uniref:Type I-MYXAN CRISPR-associated protein Cas5/Cmx5/DevS n=1 Tax=Cystobacter ferrugineus TaxID=83449 RepID=A0A1L9AV81_9BACT|nr:type I-MYXAN CRISPR-associated protein Cas5/Cmx5/DevS [Cystobacter ferrugineus]OJH33917.1 type I-MYXAN CRISPR-associated protein Cas5/Cmx5/DevS [Cystobacter ferrugineus]
MGRLWLRLRAPFAAYRPLQAGVYRATSPFLTPSAAYGLVLNLAGVETRAPGAHAITQVREDLPLMRIALGLPGKPPGVASLYQQLHTYPVGNSGKERKERLHGAKYWIAPARRELLVDLDAIVGVESTDEALLVEVGRGLRGERTEPRYGLPFAGDNNFLFDRIDLLAEFPMARWYARPEQESGPLRGSCRLTVGINRADASRTTSVFVAPLQELSSEPPEAAWIWTPRSP